MTDDPTILTLTDTGSDLIQSERYSEALSVFEAIRVLDPSNENAWLGRGISLCHLQRYSESLIAFDSALRRNSQNPETWNSKGVALFELERYGDALCSFDRALHLDPENTDFKTNRIETLKKIEEKIQREKFGEPIKDTPWLVTFLGCGGMMYWDTYYITVFFIPIFPIARYSLEKNAIFEDTFKFYGKLTLHPWQKTWQALAGGAGIGLIIGWYLLR